MLWYIDKLLLLTFVSVHPHDKPVAVNVLCGLRGCFVVVLFILNDCGVWLFSYLQLTLLLNISSKLFDP